MSGWTGTMEPPVRSSGGPQPAGKAERDAPERDAPERDAPDRDAPDREAPVARSRDVLAPSRERRAPTRGELRRRRVLVRGAKWLMPLAALGLLGVVALWPEIDSTEDNARVAFRRVTQVRPEGMRVVSPRYQGVDEQNRPYTVTAAVAVQPPGDANLMDLERPRADIQLSDGGWVLIESRQGRYDKAHQHLDLWGEVTIWHDNGTMLVTDSAAAELQAGTASGDAPVAAQGPFGTLTAEGFRIIDRGANVVFTGHEHTVLEGGR